GVVTGGRRRVAARAETAAAARRRRGLLDDLRRRRDRVPAVLERLALRVAELLVARVEVEAEAAIGDLEAAVGPLEDAELRRCDARAGGRFRARLDEQRRPQLRARARAVDLALRFVGVVVERPPRRADDDAAEIADL